MVQFNTGLKKDTSTSPSPNSTSNTWGDIKLRPWDDKMKFRINPKVRPVKRFATGIEPIDKVFGGGLPYGLTTFFGEGGSGKSLLAGNIAKGHKALYFTCEVLSDSPRGPDLPNVTTVDYTQYPVQAQRALEELFTYIEHLKPEVVVIDSLTTFFSRSRKALPESEVREMVSKLHMNAEGRIPIIGISEVRGTGFTRTTAGGEGVKHGCSMLVSFEKEFIKYESQQRALKSDYGTLVYTMQVEKDKHGIAHTARIKLIWDKKEYKIEVL